MCGYEGYRLSRGLELWFSTRPRNANRATLSDRTVAILVSLTPPYTGDQKYELVIPSAVQRLFFPDQVQDAPQTRDLVVRRGARAANKIPERRRTMKNAAAHPG